MKYHFKDLGLSNTKEMFAKANKEGYSVLTFNFNNLEQLKAIVEACAEMGSLCNFTSIKRCKRIYRKRNGSFLSTSSYRIC